MKENIPSDPCFFFLAEEEKTVTNKNPTKIQIDANGCTLLKTINEEQCTSKWPRKPRRRGEASRERRLRRHIKKAKKHVNKWPCIHTGRTKWQRTWGRPTNRIGEDQMRRKDPNRKWPKNRARGPKAEAKNGGQKRKCKAKRKRPKNPRVKKKLWRL